MTTLPQFRVQVDVSIARPTEKVRPLVCRPREVAILTFLLLDENEPQQARDARHVNFLVGVRVPVAAVLSEFTARLFRTASVRRPVEFSLFAIVLLSLAEPPQVGLPDTE